MKRLALDAPTLLCLVAGLLPGCGSQASLDLPELADAAAPTAPRRIRLPFPGQLAWGLRLEDGTLVPYTQPAPAYEYTSVAGVEADFLFAASRFLQFDARPSTKLCLPGSDGPWPGGSTFGSVDEIDPVMCRSTYGPWVQFAINGAAVSDGVGKGVVVWTRDDALYVLRIAAIGAAPDNPEGGVLIDYRRR